MERTITFRRGTFAEFQQLSPLDDNTLYFIEDIGKIYKGQYDVTAAFHLVTPEAYVSLSTTDTLPGQFYLNQDSGGLKVRETLTRNNILIDRIVEVFPGMTELANIVKSWIQPQPIGESGPNNHILVSTDDPDVPIGESEYTPSDIINRWILF